MSTTLLEQAPAPNDASSACHRARIVAHRSPYSPVSNASSTSTHSPGPTFYISYPFQLLAGPSPLNSAPYSTSQWPASSSQQLPVSSYSSLNGATTTSSHLQSQGQSSGSMVIECVATCRVRSISDPFHSPSLTTMNGTSGSPPPQFQQTSLMSSQPQSRIQYPYQQQAQSPTLSINPSFVHANTSQFPQSHQQHAISLPRNHSHSPPQQQQQPHQQQQQQQQGTLSPFALHSPTTSFYTGIPPASFYGQSVQPQAGPSSQSHSPPQYSQPSQPPPAASPPAPAPNKPSPEQRRAKLAQDVKPFIQPTSFTGAGAVSQLVNILDDYGIPEVEVSLRLEILTKIRDNAGNHYFRAWVDNMIALDIIREWLKLAFQGRNEPQLLETIMPILHVSGISISRLLFSLLASPFLSPYASDRDAPRRCCNHLHDDLPGVALLSANTQCQLGSASHERIYRSWLGLHPC